MFEQQDKGFGLGRWVYWFFGLLAIYAVTTLFPATSSIARFGLFLAYVGVGIAWQQIKRSRKD